MKLPSLASVYLVFGLAHGAALSEKVLGMSTQHLKCTIQC